MKLLSIITLLLSIVDALAAAELAEDFRGDFIEREKKKVFDDVSFNGERQVDFRCNQNEIVISASCENTSRKFSLDTILITSEYGELTVTRGVTCKVRSKYFWGWIDTSVAAKLDCLPIDNLELEGVPAFFQV